MLRHPEVAARKCDDCKQWMYLENGKIHTRGGKPVPRSGPTPCRTCPKKSPEEAHQYELSVKNKQALQFYYTTRAMSGANLTDEMRRDAIIQRNMCLIDQILRPLEAEKATESIIAPLLSFTTANPSSSARSKR